MRNIVFLGAMFCSVTIFAFTAPFATGPAPAQVYQSGNAEPSQSSVATTSPDLNSGSAIINSAGVETGSAGAIAQLSQSTLAFERHADYRIQNLTDSNHAMSTALRTIEENIMQLQQQIAMMSEAKKTAHTHHVNNTDFMFYLNLVFAGLFLLLSGLMIGKLMTRRAPIQITKNVTGGSDYDFMETAEAIPAKLDLARSYIAMHDFDQARSVLAAVLEKGNSQQRMVAETLLEKMRQ